MSEDGRRHRWLREPLLRFLALGLVLLGLDRAFAPQTEGRIVISAAQQSAARAAFRTEQGRDPDPAELQRYLDGWIDEQLLYREALARGLDRGDSIVRRQLVQKMRFVLEGEAGDAEPDEAELRDYRARHAARYAAPATTTFQHVFLSRGRHGDALPRAAADAAARLARAPEDFVGLGDPFPATQVLEAADAARIRREFGVEFAAALDALPAGAWSAPVASAFGLHLVRVTARSPGAPLPFEAVAARLRADWRAEQREVRQRAALDALRARYAVELEPAT